MNEHTVENCLICYSFVAALPPVKSQTFQSNDITSTYTMTDTLISKQANTIFVLRNLLEIPSHTLENILRKWADVGPEMWIQLCDKCSLAAEQSKVIYKELLKIKHKFGEAQRRILNRIVVTSDCNSTHNFGEESKLRTRNKDARKKPGRKGGKWKTVKDITDECREYVTNHCSKDANYFVDCTTSDQLSIQTLQNKMENKKDTKFKQVEVTPFSQEIKPEPDDVDQVMREMFDQQTGAKYREMGNEEENVECDAKFWADEVNDDSDEVWTPLTTVKDVSAKPGKTKNRLPVKTLSSRQKVNKRLTKKAPKKTSESIRRSKKVNQRARSPKKKADRKKKGRLILCELCCAYVPPSDLVEHVKAHVGEDYLIRCPNPNGCSFACFYSRSLAHHVKGKKTCMESISEAQKQEILNPQYICEICGCSCTTALALRHHITRYHENITKTFSCNVENCNKKFSTRQSVVLHLGTHIHSNRFFSTPSNVQECYHCSEKITLVEMEAHLKKVHEAVEVVTCAHCSFLFISVELLLEHLFAHRNEGLFCHHCEDQVKFSGYTKLCEHYFKVHRVGKEFPCNYCSATFVLQKGLTYHIQRKHSNNTGSEHQSLELVPKQSKPFLCDECDSAFRGQSSLVSHKMRLHGAEPYKCTFCKETFTNLGKRIRHEKEHQGVRFEEHFPCEVPDCGRSFTNRRSLKRHRSSAHKLGNTHVCDLCGQGFPYLRLLITHREKKHLNIRPHICDTCGESFLIETCLKQHKLIHTGERPYVCELCGQRFRQKEVLSRHIKAHIAKGSDFKPKGPMKQIRKRIEVKRYVEVIPGNEMP